MKKLFFICLMIVLGCATNDLYSQCVKPTPMSGQQIDMVTGTWKGNYTYMGNRQEIEITIYRKNNEVICDIANPPLKGKETAGEYFFCPGGEFHLKKYIGDTAYVFQGVPESGRIKGILSIYSDDNKRTQGGNFVLERTQ